MWNSEYEGAWESESESVGTGGDSSGGDSGSISDRYAAWLKRGKTIAATMSKFQWAIGDWVVEGQDEFDVCFQPLSHSDRHLLIQKKSVSDGGGAEYSASKVPNFWKTISDETGLTVSALKYYGYVARAFPDKKKRFKELPFNHHGAVASCGGKKYEYLKKCLDVEPGAKPRSIMWLYAFIAQQEGGNAAAPFAPNLVRFYVPDAQYAKLKQLTKFLKTNVTDFIAKAMNSALEGLLEEEARKISLDQLGFYDGQWPFEPSKPREKKAQLRRSGPTSPKQRSQKFRAKQSAQMRKAWKRGKMDGRARGTVTIRRISHNGPVS